MTYINKLSDILFVTIPAKAIPLGAELVQTCSSDYSNNRTSLFLNCLRFDILSV